MQHCNMIELRKRNFGTCTKQFFGDKLHIGYACEIKLISRLVSEAKLKCGVGWGGGVGGGARQYQKSGQVKEMDYGYV